MSFLVQTFLHFQEMTKSNPVYAGAISLWGLGVLTWIFRKVPNSVGQHIKYQCTTTLFINNADVGSNLQNFGAFLSWFEKLKWAKYSRTLSLNGVWGGRNNTVVGVGDGSHYFIYRRRLFKMTRTRLQNSGSGSYNIHYEITIRGLTRNRKILEEMVEEFRWKPDARTTCIYRFNGKDWNCLTSVRKRNIDTVVLKKDNKDEIVNLIQEFQTSRSWYENRGIAYKKTFLFHGIHGTGKTSFVRTLASYFDYNVCIINLSHMSDGSLEQAFASLPEKSFVLIEDFDSADSTKKRRHLQEESDTHTTTEPTKKDESTKNSDKMLSDGLPAYSFLTLSGLLNSLDGIIPLDNTIVFLTTNVLLASLDPALLRKGRVDHIYEFKALTHTEICEYIKLMFPDVSDEHLNGKFRFADVLGCDLQSLYSEHKNDCQAFIAALQVISETDLIPPSNEPDFEWPVSLDRAS